MAKFDPQTWKDRAWARFCRATRALKGKNKAKRQAVLEATWFSDVVSAGDLTKLIAWCTERCIDVNFIKKPLGVYVVDSKVINISSRLRPVKQVAVLLHECGHHLVGSADRHDRFLMGYPQTDPEVVRTFHHRVACLEEEMEAWHRGWKLSTRLKLSIPREDFDAVRLDCLRSYISWSLRPGRKEKED
jgi:hypothetical protein